ncbi:MAG: 23S rRNA (cytosine(1962)-C(5))-methyltransferase RlmI [Gammaproteobacteria bacterium]|nr:MAG: 23S rRNA (cytosine(1962)-C(5))-methyltransferase RlmI [Gammaproteobacteria bacterium]
MKQVVLKEGRDRSLLRRHPWVFSGGIARVTGKPAPGETVEVCDAAGYVLGFGAWSPDSQIRVRMWTFDPAEAIDEDFFSRRIATAITLRESLGIPTRTNALRLISSEGDDLPGVIVDRYGEYLVGQFLSCGAEVWKDAIAKSLLRLTGARGFYERSDVPVRRKEGLEPRQGLLLGEDPPALIEMEEDGVRYNLDIREGHKTGFYLDQRDNRALVRAHSDGAEVLNCFSYTGGFGLAALHGGATQATNVEDVAGLRELSEQNRIANGFDETRCVNLKGDVFRLLREYVEQGRRFDLVVLDPPKFAESQGQLQRACRGYKDINRLALKLLRPGGLLFTFSCSGLMKLDLFQKVVADAALDAGVDAQILQVLSQAPDHPVKIQIPETAYLKGLLLRVVNLIDTKT